MNKIIPALILSLCIPALACSPDLSSEKAQYSYGFGFQVGALLKKRPSFKKEGIIEGVRDAMEGKQVNGDKSRQVGNMLGKRYHDQGIDIDVDVFSTGLTDGYEGNDPRIDRNTINAAITALHTRMGKKNLQAGSAYLASNKKKQGVKVTASGLQYKIVTRGTGRRPSATDKVRVHYTGKLINGQVFDSSIARNAPAEFYLNKVIKGWTEGVQLMKVGSKYEFTIPPALGYGPRGAGSIPGNSVLIFEVQLLGIIR